jgi:AraC-like DNA-binding protein
MNARPGDQSGQQVNTSVLSSDDLPADFDDRARFARWHEVFESLTCCTDYFRREDRPFNARFKWVQLAGAHVTQFSGTISRITRSASAIARGPDDDFCILLNRGTSAFVFSQLGNEPTVAPGGALLATNGAAADIAIGDCQFGTVTIKRDSLRKLVAGVDGLLTRPIDSRQPALRYLSRYVESVLDFDGAGHDRALEGHISTTLLDLAALSLRANGEVAEIARTRGLRAARLQEILRAIERDFTDPALSSAGVGQKLGLSSRYIQDLLHETGTTFSERVLELRLQEARRKLTTRQHDKLKISEIAYACGFNEVSYFNQCFRRRFGVSPTQVRGQAGG